MSNPLTPEQIAEHLLSDPQAYNEFIKGMLIKHLETPTSEKIYWDAWFRGATGNDLVEADSGKVFTN
jgi:hypothetical protein